MANNKRKCAYCKERFNRDKEGSLITKTQYFCSYNHLKAYADNKKPKTEKKLNYDAKKKLNRSNKGEMAKKSAKGF